MYKYLDIINNKVPNHIEKHEYEIKYWEIRLLDWPANWYKIDIKTVVLSMFLNREMTRFYKNKFHKNT